MATDVLLGGFLLTREEWEAMDDDERLMLVHAVVEPNAGEGAAATPRRDDASYHSSELTFAEPPPARAGPTRKPDREPARAPEKLAS